MIKVNLEKYVCLLTWNEWTEWPISGYVLTSSFLSDILRDYERLREQTKSVLQPAIWASCSQHVLAHKSFKKVPKPFLISRIDYNPSVIWISQKNSTWLSRNLTTKITSPIAKSNSPRLSNTNSFARRRLELHFDVCHFSINRFMLHLFFCCFIMKWLQKLGSFFM